jgi:hypothetical protein
MKVFISYSKKFKENLAWVIEKNEEEERLRLENERKRIIAEEIKKEEERFRLAEKKRRENQFVSRFEFGFQRKKKDLITRPDLRDDIDKEKQEIQSKKDQVLKGQVIIDHQLKLASEMLRDLEKVIIEQDLRT